jgi:hypothetical protein
MIVHDFHDSLATSKRHANASWWLPVCQHFFPDLTEMRIEEDIAYQTRGVDRRVKLTGIPARVQLIEEKVREKVYDDIALELWSNFERQILGWIERPNQLSDFLIYVFLASAEAYLLPFQPLRSAWIAHRDEWIATFPRIVSQNKGYTTISCGVPIPVIGETVGFQRFCWCETPASAIAAGRQWEFVTGRPA